MSARRGRLTAALGLVCALPLAAQTHVAAPAGGGDLDAQRAAWRYRRAVALSGTAQATAALALPPELYAHAQPELRDLRLIDAEGREVPYVLDRREQREAVAEWSGLLSDVRREDKRLSQWQVDLGETRVFDEVTLEVPGSGFAKRLRLEASGDGREWRLLRDDAGIFERDWNGRLRHTTVPLAAPARARFLRLGCDDRASPPIDLTGVKVRSTRRTNEERWQREVGLTAAPAAAGRRRFRLELAPGLPVETLVVDSDDAVFSRQARLVERGQTRAAPEERVLGEGRVFRWRADDPALGGEQLSFDIQRPGRGTLLLELDDGDSPPLRALRVRVSGVSERLLFPTSSGAVALYYGNERTRAPLYDLEALRGRLGSAADLAQAHLGDELPNPLHAPAPPLAFIPTAGAPLNAARWRFARRFTLGPAEDIFALVLGADDLGLARDDLADLRVCDASGRQVPYILERAGGDERVELAWEAEAAGGGRRDGSSPPSRYRLTRRAAQSQGLPAHLAPAAKALPLVALELEFAQGFFVRPARLLADGERGSRERLLWSGSLSRAADAPGTPFTLPLDGARQAALVLEIDEGDDAPLKLAGAWGVVRTARVTFKAAPGEYRLLLGNDEALAPRYDIHTLRREVLAYSAVPVTAGALEDNPAFRRRAADYFASAPPTVLMWGVLLAAVAALLALTARVLRKSEP